MLRQNQAWLVRLGCIGVVAGACLAIEEGHLLAADEHFGIPQVKFINEQVTSGWSDAGLQPSAAATDGEWCRRLYLDVIGRVPKAKELQDFIVDSSPTKRPEAASRLLGESYEDDYARHWTDVWTTILIGRDVANQEVNRAGMRQYLRRSFSKNIPYDQFMEELVTATGLNANMRGVEGFNGATNFLSGKMEENGAQATAKTAQVFLGLQVQCTQCHNHPFNKGKQNQFWEFNAFFRQSRALKKSAGDLRWVEMVNEDFAGEGGNPEEAELYYELRNGLMKVAFPVFVDGTEISKNGYLPGKMADGTEYGINRRLEVAQLIKASPLLSKASKGNTKDDPSLGEKPRFSHFYLRQMQAEQLYESLLTATEADQAQGEAAAKKKDEWLKQFVIAFGTDEGDDSTTFNGSIPQVLMMFNGDLVKNATATGKGGFLDKVASAGAKNPAKIDALYMAALARKPSVKELDVANLLMNARKGDAAAALQDVWWAVLNSNEFIINH